MGPLLVVAAWEPELSHFRTLVSASMDVRLVDVGVGLVDAAVGTTRALMAHHPRSALLLGTCGAFEGRGLAIGDVVVGSTAAWVDAAYVSGHAALPPSLVVAVEADPSVADAARRAGAQCVQIATTAAVTTDAGLAAHLRATGDVEHLEAFAFARACATASPPVPWTIVLGVANMVGPGGRDEWRANHVMASKHAAEVASAMFLPPGGSRGAF